MPIAAMLPAIVQLLGLAAKAVEDGPEIVASIKGVWTVATAKTAPTPEQQAEYDRALDEAHRALQAS